MNNAESLAWFKSSYSNSEGGQCVEVSLAWFKSSYSNSEGGNCVEVAACPDSVHVRDSKAAAGPVLQVSPQAWAGFVGLASSARYS